MNCPKSLVSIKTKIIIFSCSLILSFISILLFFLDKYYEWNIYKLLLCIAISIWVLFIIPSYCYGIILVGNMSCQKSTRVGLFLGAFGIIIVPILLAPYFGIKYILFKTNDE